LSPSGGGDGGGGVPRWSRPRRGLATPRRRPVGRERRRPLPPRPVRRQRCTPPRRGCSRSPRSPTTSWNHFRLRQVPGRLLLRCYLPPAPSAQRKVDSCLSVGQTQRFSFLSINRPLQNLYTSSRLRCISSAGSQNDCTSLLFRFRLFLTRSALYSLCPEPLLYLSLSRV